MLFYMTFKEVKLSEIMKLENSFEVVKCTLKGFFYFNILFFT